MAKEDNPSKRAKCAHAMPLVNVVFLHGRISFVGARSCSASSATMDSLFSFILLKVFLQISLLDDDMMLALCFLTSLSSPGNSGISSPNMSSAYEIQYQILC